MGIRLAILLCLISVSFGRAWGCRAAPEGVQLSHEESIERSDVIFLGHPVSVSQNEAYFSQWETYNAGGGELPTERYRFVYTFQVGRCLKGDCPKTFEFRGFHPEGVKSGSNGTGLDTAQRSHESSEFWRGTWGRLGSDTACRVGASFELGQKYLILSEPELSFGAELITDGDDAWLKYVEQYVDDSNTRKPFPKPFNEYLRSADGIAIVNTSNADVEIEVLKGLDKDFAFLRNPIENTWRSDLLPCENGDADRYESLPPVYLMVIEEKIRGARRLSHDCDKETIWIEWARFGYDEPTLSEAGITNFTINNGEVMFSDGLFTAPLPAGLSKNAIGPKINKIAVDDLRQILESYQDKPEADK